MIAENGASQNRRPHDRRSAGWDESTSRVQPVAEAPADAAASFRQRLGGFVAAARRVSLDAAGTS
jgi:hypothetical protein